MSTLDTSGMFLEGVRISTGDNPFTFPPRNFVLAGNEPTFQTPAGRAEYVIIVDSISPLAQSMEIADPSLRFLWTRNDTGATRFDWDGFGRRWLPSPGAPPDIIGTVSNSPRLIAAVPDPTIASAPFSFYVGTPTRLVTFAVSVVSSSASFTAPGSLPAGSLEIAKDTGEINFSSTDLNLYAQQTLYGQRQSFFDRSKNKGVLGSLPFSSVTPYFIFMNPLPGTGQVPRVRIGYGPYLTAVEVPNEASLGSPVSGTFTWSKDTGRLRFANVDVDSNQEATVYYDGVTIGSFQLDRTGVGPISTFFPSPLFSIPGFIGESDAQKYVVFVELAGQPRNYFTVQVIDISSSIPTDPPSSGTVYMDTATGSVFFSIDDLIQYVGWTVSYVHSVATVERGVSFQVFRSGVNGAGEPAAPDFVIRYAVSGQIVQDGIGASPFVMLPITPIVDSTLVFSVESGPGSTGTFSGDLAPGVDPTKPGFGYLLDLDQHQLKFAFRKTVNLTLAKPTPVVKLADAAISARGFEVTLDGNPIIPGIDFNFNADTGLLEFIDPVGEDDPKNILGIAGSVTLPSSFTANKPVFAPELAGKFLFFAAGDNAGIYHIASINSSTKVTVDEVFTSSGPDVADLRQSQETVADRFWTEFKPGFKKFSLAKALSPAGPYFPMAEDEFSVQPSVGQIALITPAKPGESFQATYIFLSSPDNGVTITPIPKVEKAIFKIRQEAGVTTVGSKTVSFNLTGNTVSLDRPIQVAINGQTQDPQFFTFIAPSMIQLANPVKAGDAVIIDYWVFDAPGGNTSFNLLSIPIDLDPPSIAQGVDTAQFNGDQRPTVSPGSAFFIGEKDVVIVQTVAYDPTADMTNVVFEQITAVSSDNSALLVTGPVTGSYRIIETSPVDVFPKGTNVISIAGDRPYKSGMIVTVDGDPYSVLNAKFDAKSGQTKVTVATAAYRNYIIPDVTRTVRPVLKSDSKFTTEKAADLDFPITLIKMGTNRGVLVKDVDFTVAEGGIIALSVTAQFGDSLHAMYVARKSKPAGSKFVLNYSHAIAPSASNGLFSQRLLASYTLYAPDTFFYRVESFSTYLPEVIDILKQSAQSGGASGPDTASKTSMKTKDFGRPSLFFPEQAVQNVDSVIIHLLKYYNDLINLYEDLLANMDGRVVGGTDGRFRFDGKTNNPPRTNLSAVTNDIDDRVKLFDLFELTGFFSFALVPFYDIMGGVNRFSRFFRTVITASAALNSQVTFLDLLKPMGSLQLNGNPVNNIRFAFGLTSAFANGVFTSTSGGGTILKVPTNGDTKKLVPQFAANQHVRLYAPDGTPNVLAKIIAVIGSGPYSILLDTPTLLTSGSLLQDGTDPSDTSIHFYVNGRDLIIDFDSGQVDNFTLPPPLDAIQNAPVGNEIVNGPVLYIPQNTKALRIPSLDGLEQLDDGRVSQPQIKYRSETGLLAQEQSALNNFGTAKVTPDFLTLSALSFPVSVGDLIQFVSGPNAGLTRTVNLVFGPIAIVSAPWASLDLVGHDMIKVPSDGVSIGEIINREIGVLHDNAASSPGFPALIGVLQGELPTADAIVRSFGTQQAAGTGNAGGTVLTDAGADFLAAGVGVISLVYIPSGPNIGVYKVLSATKTTITVDSTAPFTGFPFAIASPYVIIKRYQFIGLKGPQFMTGYLSKTTDFYNSTQTWAGSLSSAGKVARNTAIAARLTDVAGFIKSIASVLGKGDKLYDVRYLWIDQRINRKTGTLTSLVQAQSKRQEDLAKLLEDQQKLLTLGTLIV